MSNAITRILFTGASIALTFGLAVTSAFASVPSETTIQQTTVHYADLDLSKADGLQTLARRLSIAAERVCPTATTPLETITCRTTAIAKARAQLARTGKTQS